jgi:hypothetical protein
MNRNIRVPARGARAVAAILSAFTWLTASGHAQSVPAAVSLPVVVQLQHGRPFVGDVRQFPSSLPSQQEHRPDRGEDPMLPPVSFGDQAAQRTAPAAPAPSPGSGGGAGNFAGLSYSLGGGGWPPDTNGDVGPVFYLQTVNTSLGIFRKSDGALLARFTFDALMGQGNQGNLCDTDNFGDPVVVWDSAADRWIVTDFAFALDQQGEPMAPFYQCFAVSRTGDPLAGGWYFYSLQTTDYFPDYPKLGVWPDGLYLTANLYRASNFRNVRVWALDKSQMYAGAAANAVMFNLPATTQGVSLFTALPSTYHAVTGTPPAGRPNLISMIWSAKLARVWKFHVDWTNTANSTLIGPSNVTLASWGVAPATVPAKNGNALDSLRERLMVQSQYTNIGGVESLWLTHTVAHPGNSALASPRWYQLNVTGGIVVTSAPLQQSTWAPESTVSRWMPSLAVDQNGSMAIGYSAASSTLFPAIRYAGRLASDPLHTLGQSETSLIEGNGSQCCNLSNGSPNNRWGDYTAMTIDPDGCTFWYTNEYYATQPTLNQNNNWQTRIGSFRFSNCTPNSGTVQGSVTALATGNPISGATVAAGATSTATDGSGQYTLNSLAAGTYTVTASAQGYATGSASVTVSAGSTTVQNFALAAIASASTTTLAVQPSTGVYGGATTLSATLTSGGTGVSGKTISFTLNGSPKGTAVTDGSGVATASGVSLAGIGAGSYATGVAASFAGDGSFAASTGTNTLTIDKANQTITFGPLPGKTTGDPPFTVDATASSGLAVSFAATGQCTVSGNTVTVTAAGSCTITASQAGDSNHNAALSVPQTFTITSSSGGGTSPDGTTIPPASQIVDNAGAVWTIGSAQLILRNGVQAAGGFGSKILWKNATIYVLGTDANWWQWTGSGWVNVGATQPGSFEASADGSTVPPAMQIVDSIGAVWTIGSGEAILRNGIQANGGYGSKILWKNATVYVLGTDTNWWQWTGSGWTLYGPTPPGSIQVSPDGTTVPPATQIVDNAGAVWTIGSGQVILRNGVQANGGFGSEMLWKNSTIYVLGTDSTWWRWTGTGWINVGSAHP